MKRKKSKYFSDVWIPRQPSKRYIRGVSDIDGAYRLTRSLVYPVAGLHGTLSGGLS